MNTRQFLTGFTGSVAFALISACGGSSSGGGTVIIDPIFPENVNSVGVITALESASVNGVRFNTDDTTVLVNGQAGAFADLKLGQVVAISGILSADRITGTANELDYNATCIGPVESIDADNGQLIVMGQTVLTDASTEFDASIDPATFDGLTVGENAQISGFKNADGDILASRIDPDTTSIELAVIGTVADLDLANSLFSIGRLTVDYSNPTMIDLPGGAPVDGQFLSVRGDLVNGILAASTLEGIFDMGGVPGRRIQFSGFITDVISALDITVNEFPISVDSSTAFAGGTSADLDLNAQITVDGNFSSDGLAISADTITFGSVLSDTVTLTFGFADFTEINVFNVFNVSISQGDNFLAEVTIDQEDVGRVNASQTGNAVDLRLEPAQGDVNIQTLDAVFTLPVLDAIRFDGVINGTVSGFNQSQMTANVLGVSALRGEAMMLESLSASVLGVSRLNFGEISPLSIAQLEISGVSSATVNMGIGASLSGSVTGVSSLRYYGTDVTISVTTGTGSSVVNLGDTRP